MNQKRRDELIIMAERRHKATMEKLTLAYLGKRADGIQDNQRQASQDNEPDGGERGGGSERPSRGA